MNIWTFYKIQSIDVTIFGFVFDLFFCSLYSVVVHLKIFACHYFCIHLFIHTKHIDTTKTIKLIQINVIHQMNWNRYDLFLFPSACPPSTHSFHRLPPTTYRLLCIIGQRCGFSYRPSRHIPTIHMNRLAIRWFSLPPKNNRTAATQCYAHKYELFEQ